MSHPPATIYINPKFRNAHINPNFLPKFRHANQQQQQPPVPVPTQQENIMGALPPPLPSLAAVPTSIFINPNFLRTNNIVGHLATPQMPNFLPPPTIPIVPTAPTPQFTLAKIITQTNRKLVRQPQLRKDPQVCLQNIAPTQPRVPLIRVGIRKLVRRVTSSAAKSPVSLRSSNLLQKAKLKTNRLNTPSKYRVRNNNAAVAAGIATTNQFRFDRRVPAIVTRHKLQRTTPIVRTHCKLAYLNINGVAYKSTSNQLQRHDHTNKATALPTTATSSGTMFSSAAALSVIVRGTKYSVSADGKCLKRIPAALSAPASATAAATAKNSGARLDIGGMTYVRIAPDTFERTDGHRTRDHLSAARQKSIQLLLNARSLTKCNVPCPIYQRLGKCRGLERGRCPRVHDAKRVAICPKFLQGNCPLDGCLLSHAVTLAKMPTCKFFLAGICVRDVCPYLHKKLNARTDICADFLRGFCERAEQCDKRHEFLCAHHEATGKCERVRCPYPHRQADLKTKKKLPQRRQDAETTEIRNVAGSTTSNNVQNIVAPVKKMNVRYTANSCQNDDSTPSYVTNKAALSHSAASVAAISTNDATNSDDVLVLIPSRPKLGELPAFIPF